MNILMLSTHCNAGGITSYLLTLSAGLIRRGHTVHVATSGGNLERNFQSIGAKLLTLNIRTKSELDPRIYTALAPLTQYVNDNNIDLFHAHTRITQVMGVMLKRRTRKPCLSTCHGYFKRRLSRRLFPCWGDAVIAISKAVEDHLLNDFHVPPNTIALIENGIDLNEFKAVDQAYRKKLRERFGFGNEFIVGNIARLSDVKGPDLLIKAMRTVVDARPGTKLVLVGEGKMAGMLHAMVDRLGLQDHVRFLAIVNKSSELLPLFDIFVMPSRQEGLGLSILEAQATGLPVIATNVGGIPGLIENGQTGILVEPENCSTLADAVICLMNDNVQRQHIGRLGREFIQKKYRADQMVEKTLTLYQRMSHSRS